MEYYKNLITEKSFTLLQKLRREYDFILIGGWAVFLYTQALKSKDIDVIVGYEVLEKMREKFTVIKNGRLKKYEINLEEIDVDIYVPFYSDLGIPVEEVQKHTRNIEGFLVPRPEILLILKQRAYLERQGSAKGEKDKIDILGMLQGVDLDFVFYKKILSKFDLIDYAKNLKHILQRTTAIPELNLNEFKTAKFKKKVLNQF